MGKKVCVTMLLALAIIGCATNTGLNYLVLPFEHQPRVHVEPVLTFEITATEFVEVKEVKIHVDCEPEKSKGFILCCRHGNEYLHEMASGLPQTDGTVSFHWMLADGVVIGPNETAVFEVTSIDRSYHGTVTLISNGLDPDGSDLANPPENNPPEG